MSKSDFDAEEKEFRREIAAALNEIRSSAGRCPHPDQLMAAALASAVLVSGTSVLRQPAQQKDQSVKVVEPSPRPPNAKPVALVLEKAAIKVPAAAVLIYRSGGESTKAFLDELAAALEPY